MGFGTARKSRVCEASQFKDRRILRGDLSYTGSFAVPAHEPAMARLRRIHRGIARHDWSVLVIPHGHGPIDPRLFSPYPKNPVIAKVFKEIGWADELGSGVRKLFRYGKAFGGYDPELIEGDIFRINLRLATNRGGGSVESSVETEGVTVETEDQILNALRNDPEMTLADVATSIEKSLRTVERVSSRLVREQRKKACWSQEIRPLGDPAMKRSGLCPDSPEAEAALRRFLSQFVLADKRSRYLDLISRPKGRRKFLDTLYHEFETHLDPTKAVTKLTEAQLSLPGFRFDHHHDFGEAVDALATVCALFDESFLVVSTDGNVGIHRPESYIDRRTYYIA